MNEKVILTAENYDRIDGRNAYWSAVKRLTLGSPCWEENKNMQIAAQLLFLLDGCSFTKS